MMRRALAVMVVTFAVVAASVSALAAPVAVSLAVPVATQVVTAAQLAAVADRVAHLTVVDPDRPVAPAFALADQHVPPGTVAIAAQPPQVNTSYVAVPIQISVDGHVVRTVIAGYRVEQYVRTAVAAHDLQQGALISSDDLMLARVLSIGRPAVGFDALVGRKIRAATARGEQIYPEQTAVNELVKTGQSAILIIHDGSVQLVADVVARSSGGLGDTVTVYNPNTNKAISGTVTGPERVELTLPQGDSE